MKKTNTLLLLLIAIGVSAQTECKIKLDSIKKIMEKETFYKNYDKMFKDLLPCAEAGIPMAQNYVGLFYLEGLGTTKDEAKGLQYLEQAANKNNAAAQYNLGNMYREGKGVGLNMDKAVYWYQKAVEQKNKKAAYSLGYMYLKGFGVTQNYQLAVSWFEKSQIDMAKHWLGVCYYLGYGVLQDTDKALDYFFSNGTPNSKAFLKNLKIDKREQVLDQAQTDIEKANEGDKKIDPKLIASSREEIEKEVEHQKDLKTKDILGEWTGRLIDYDWSGKVPLRVLPIEIVFSKNETGDLKTKIIFDGKTIENASIFDDNTLFVQGFNFKLDQLYSHNFDNFKLDYSVLGMHLSKKTYNKTPYLLADVDSFIGVFKEPGTPISLVLRPKTDTEINSQEDQAMLAMAAQTAEFIKVYPVPFNDQLYIAFDLPQAAAVQVTLTSVTTAQTVQVATTQLAAGMQSYTVDTATLPKGYYVIRVLENQKLHTRIVLKQ